MADLSLSNGMTKAEALRLDSYKFAMWLYMGSETILFSIFIGAYALLRLHEPEVIKQVHENLGILLVTINTFLLLTSSWSMVMGLRQIQRGNADGLIRWFSLTALLGIVFMAGQYYEYSELAHLGVTLNFTGNEWQTFGMHFYVPTFFHGIHILVGVIWCLILIRNAKRGDFSSTRYVSVEVFGLYWHFVDVVWIILFTLIYLI